MLGWSPFAGSQVRIYLYAKDVDMRKSFDGLHAIIQADFRKDIRLGDVFLFLNRRLDRLKLVGWDGDGMMIVYKRLEKGTFQRPLLKSYGTHIELDATELALLLTGVELKSVKRRPRYSAPRADRELAVATTP